MVAKRTQADFQAAAQDRYLPKVLDLLTHKGEQYSDDHRPALRNFTETAEILGHTPAHHLMTLATKQWFVLCSWSHNGTWYEAVRQEVVQRIMDIIVYMLLLLFMLEGEASEKDTDNIFG